MIIGAGVTHPDWAAAWGNWGRVGVQRIVDACASGDIRQIYWRAGCGARFFYPSAFEETFKGAAQEACEVPEYWKVTLAHTDYRTWDLLREAVDCTLKAGLQPWVWYSLYEESHGQVPLTRFAQAHPEFRAIDRDGRSRSSRLSFAFAEVRQHKLDLVEEMMGYGFKGLLLDFVRQLPQIDENLPPQVDENGVCRYGYADAALESCRLRHGIDPKQISNGEESWVQHRVGYVTQFMTELHERRIGTGSGYPAGILGQPESPLSRTLPDWPRYVHDGLLEETDMWRSRTDALHGSLVDWQSWVRRGLVEEVHVMVPEWNLAQLDPQTIRLETQAARPLAGPDANILTCLYCYNMEQLGLERVAPRLEAGATAASEAGADGVGLWESTSIESWSGWDK